MGRKKKGSTSNTDDTDTHERHLAFIQQMLAICHMQRLSNTAGNEDLDRIIRQLEAWARELRSPT